MTPHKRLKSAAIWLFVRQPVQANNKENIKAPHCLPFEKCDFYDKSQ